MTLMEHTGETGKKIKCPGSVELQQVSQQEWCARRRRRGWGVGGFGVCGDAGLDFSLKSFLSFSCDTTLSFPNEPFHRASSKIR